MKQLLALGALLVASTTAWALDYKVGSGSVDLNDEDPGLVLHHSMSPGLSGYSFNLIDEGSDTFDFFKIWTNEDWVHNDDKVARSIIATLEFITPEFDAVIEGTTRGAVILCGLFQYGKVTWSDPQEFILPDRTVCVSLSDAVFNEGCFGLDEGRCDGALITATVTQCSSVVIDPQTTVADGGMTLSLFGAALLGLLAFRRKSA